MEEDFNAHKVRVFFGYEALEFYISELFILGGAASAVFMRRSTLAARHAVRQSLICFLPRRSTSGLFS